MPTKLDISGTYSRQGANFFPQATNKPTLVFATRRKTTPNKTPNYLLCKLDAGGFAYVSSLYEIERNKYSLDYPKINPIKYVLTLTSDKAIIEPK